MHAQALGKYANVQPPVQGGIIAITLDAVSRIKDLGALALGGDQVDKNGDFFLSIRADVKFWLKFNSANAGTVDETAADAAAAAPITFQANAALEVAAAETVRFHLNRKNHRYLLIKGSGAGTVRMWVSSEVTGK